jgi:hypothetical protein
MREFVEDVALSCSEEIGHPAALPGMLPQALVLRSYDHVPDQEVAVPTQCDLR